MWILDWSAESPQDVRQRPSLANSCQRQHCRSKQLQAAPLQATWMLEYWAINYPEWFAVWPTIDD
jgi:hypothetical protein